VTPTPNGGAESKPTPDNHHDVTRTKIPVDSEQKFVVRPELAAPLTLPVQVNLQQPAEPTQLKVSIKPETATATPLVLPVQIQPTVTGMSPVTIPIEVSVTVKQQIDAGSVTPSPQPKNKEEDYIGHISSGDLLTLIVALAAYVAAVRIFLTERRHDLRRQSAASMSPRQADKPEINESGEKRQDDPAENINKTIKRLIPADFLFVLAALLLSWRLFIPGQVRPYPWMIWSLFIIALLYLAGLHFLAWRKHRAYIALRDLLLKLRSRQQQS
jgi:hypothetical protein